MPDAVKDVLSKAGRIKDAGKEGWGKVSKEFERLIAAADAYDRKYDSYTDDLNLLIQSINRELATKAKELATAVKEFRTAVDRAEEQKLLPKASMELAEKVLTDGLKFARQSVQSELKGSLQVISTDLDKLVALLK